MHAKQVEPDWRQGCTQTTVGTGRTQTFGLTGQTANLTTMNGFRRQGGRLTRMRVTLAPRYHTNPSVTGHYVKRPHQAVNSEP